MKNIIILCSPTSDDFRNVADTTKGYFLPPLGLLLVAQTLKNTGYEIKFYDGCYDLDYKKNFIEYVSRHKEKILFIGFYLAFLQVSDFLEATNAVKTIGANIPIVVGGPFPSVFSEVLMRSRLVQVCCRGDGAEIAKSVAQCLSEKNDLKNVPNVAFLDGDKIVFNQITHRDCLTRGNRIFYEQFIDIELYVNKFGLYLTREHNSSIKRALPILTGLGCSYKCAFCENALLGHKHLSLSAEEIVEQIVYYNETFNIDTFALFDEDFFLDKPRLYAFLEILSKKNLKIKWGSQCRANYFNEGYINRDLLKKLESVGCVRIAIGAESGSPKVLKKIKKGITPEQLIGAAQYGRDSSIYFTYSFIVNFPFETREDLKMTLDIMQRLVSIKKNSYISGVHRYYAYPGTPLSLEAEKQIGYKFEKHFNRLEQFANLSLDKYNNLVNKQKKDMYRECMIYHSHILLTPLPQKFGIRTVYLIIYKTLATIRRKLNFYYFPIEIYFADSLKSRIRG